MHRQQGLLLSVFVDDITFAGKKQNLDPMWKKWMKHVDLGEPTSFLDHVYLGCTQCECKPDESSLTNTERCSNRNSLPEQLKSCLVVRNRMRKRSLGLMTWEDKKCVERYCETANNKRSNNCIRSPHHVLTTINSKTRRIANGGSICQRSALKSS